MAHPTALQARDNGRSFGGVFEVDHGPTASRLMDA